MANVGDIKIVRSVLVQHGCEVCGEDATRKHTYLLPNARSNSASNAYGRDDCTWCSDHELFTCDAHPERPEVDGYRWCATFMRERFPHMFTTWQKLDEQIVPSSKSGEGK